MQIINKTVRCSECGCIAFPDSMYCPKCGASFRNNKIKRFTFENPEPVKLVSDQEKIDLNQSIIEAYYELISPHYGQINIRTTFVIPSVKCPQC
jgi:hypothetical protein